MKCKHIQARSARHISANSIQVCFLMARRDISEYHLLCTCPFLLYSTENCDVKVQAQKLCCFLNFSSFVVSCCLQTPQGSSFTFLNLSVVPVMDWMFHFIPEEMALKSANLCSPFLRADSAICHDFSLFLLF